MDTTYTVELTETQYAALLDRAAELEIESPQPIRTSL